MLISNLARDIKAIVISHLLNLFVLLPFIDRVVLVSFSLIPSNTFAFSEILRQFHAQRFFVRLHKPGFRTNLYHVLQGFVKPFWLPQPFTVSVSWGPVFSDFPVFLWTKFRSDPHFAEISIDVLIASNTNNIIFPVTLFLIHSPFPQFFEQQQQLSSPAISAPQDTNQRGHVLYYLFRET